jgi:bifunctional non-homologous end joining protein LigD
MASTGANSTLQSRTLLPSCAAALQIIDGEVIVQDERGVSDFDALRLAIKQQPHRLIFYAFDLLHLNGKDLRDGSLLERRGELKELLGADQTSRLQFSEEFLGDGAAFFQTCAAHGLEGVVSKLGSSRYRSGRSKTWLKTKCFTENAFISSRASYVGGRKAADRASLHPVYLKTVAVDLSHFLAD